MREPASRITRGWTTSHRVATLFLVVLAACTDATRPVVPHAAVPHAAVPLLARFRVRCVGAPGTSAVSCATEQPTSVGAAPGGVRADVVLPPDAVRLILVIGPNPFDLATRTLSLDVSVLNVSGQALGGGGGVKVFYSQVPRVLAGSGTVTVANADGVGTFTAPDQPFYLYNDLIPSGRESSRKRWQWRFAGDVQAWSFDVAVAAVVSTVASYAVVELGTLGGDSAVALDVNDRREVVGWSATASGQTHAFRWTQAGGMIDLGTLPDGDFSEATGINNSGQVVGMSTAGDGTTRAFSWTAAGGMREIGTLPGYVHSAAMGINDAGQVAGFSSTDPPRRPFPFVNAETFFLVFGPRAFVWTEAGGMQDLGALQAGVCNNRESLATAINNLGQVTGESRINIACRHQGFFWTPADGMRGILGQNAYAYAINDLGQVVGLGPVGGIVSPVAMVWTEAEGSRPLPPLFLLNGFSHSAAFGINNHGAIVGWAQLRTAVNSHAVVWSDPVTVADIDPDATRTSEARSISDVGDIVGWGRYGFNARRALLWTRDALTLAGR